MSFCSRKYPANDLPEKGNSALRAASLPRYSIIKTAGTIITETSSALLNFSGWDAGRRTGICPSRLSVSFPYLIIGKIRKNRTNATVATSILKKKYPLQKSSRFSVSYREEKRTDTMKNINGTSPASRTNSPCELTLSFSSKEKYFLNLSESNESLRAMAVLFSEQSFDQFFMEMDGVEQGLYVDLAFPISGIQVHLDTAARGHFAV